VKRRLLNFSKPWSDGAMWQSSMNSSPKLGEVARSDGGVCQSSMNSSPKLGEVPVRAEECVNPATLKNSSPKLGEVPVRAEECVSPAWGPASLLDTLPRPAATFPSFARLPVAFPPNLGGELPASPSPAVPHGGLAC